VHWLAGDVPLETLVSQVMQLWQARAVAADGAAD
jgi:hypothetical protein